MPAVNWGQRPSKKAQAQEPATSALDNFVSPEKGRATKRLNAEIPATLHARIKAQCAMAGKDMTEALIEILEQRFPER